MAVDMDAVKRAFELRQAGKLAEALDLFRTLIAVTEDPDEKAGLYLQEAAALAALGQHDDAKAALRRARAASRKPWLAAYADEQEALVSMSEGNYEAALRIFDGIFSQYPFVSTDPAHRQLYESVQVQRGILLSALGRSEEAIKVLAESLKFELSEHERGTAIFNIGKCFLALKDQDQARAAFEEVPMVCQDRDCVLPARFNLGMIYANEGRLGSALREFKWCEANGGVEDLPSGVLYSCIAEVLEAAGVAAEAERYRKMVDPKLS